MSQKRDLKARIKNAKQDLRAAQRRLDDANLKMAEDWLKRTKGKTCICGFGPQLTMGQETSAWHRAHREHHLRHSPDTLDRLDMWVEIFETRERLAGHA